MTKKKAPSKAFTNEETRLIEQLREHPELWARFRSILELARNEGAALKTADEVEALLVEEMRRLGHAGRSAWAVRAEERVGREFKEQEPGVRSRKKKR